MIAVLDAVFSLSFYQLTSLFLNGVTSLLLVYFGLHQYARNLRMTRDPDIRINSVRGSLYGEKIIYGEAKLEIENLGPGNASPIIIDSWTFADFDVVLAENKRERIPEDLHYDSDELLKAPELRPGETIEIPLPQEYDLIKSLKDVESKQDSEDHSLQAHIIFRAGRKEDGGTYNVKPSREGERSNEFVFGMNHQRKNRSFSLQSWITRNF